MPRLGRLLHPGMCTATLGLRTGTHEDTRQLVAPSMFDAMSSQPPNSDATLRNDEAFDSKRWNESLGGHLVVVGSNPPTTSGLRTLNRSDLARSILGFRSVEVGNLFGLPTYRTGAITAVGVGHENWQVARAELGRRIARADGVLLAYGVAKPSGPARVHHDAQVKWLNAVLGQRRLPVWWVGGAPRHPSRWQRYTYRHYPGVAFLDALAQALSLKDCRVDQTSDQRSASR